MATPPLSPPSSSRPGGSSPGASGPGASSPGASRRGASARPGRRPGGPTRVSGLAGVLALLLLAGCDDATGPEAETTFDAEAALEDYRAVDGLLDSPGWMGFQVVGAHLSLDGGGALGSLTEATGPMVETAARTRAPGLSSRAPDADRLLARARALAAAPGLAGPAGAPIISGIHRGKTFVWDPDAEEYVVDPERTDAPAHGVRFVVYEETAPGVPDPDAPVGYADLVDEGDGSAEDVVLRLELVVDAVQVLSYRTAVDTEGARITVEVDGFLQDPEGPDRLDFDLRVEGPVESGGGAADLEFEMGIDARDFEIVGSVRGVEDDGTGRTDIFVRHGDDSLGVEVEATASTLAGTILLDGELFATVSGHPDAPTFTGASGDDLTGREVAVLLRVVAVVVDVLVLFNDLVEPVAGLVGLGLIL